MNCLSDRTIKKWHTFISSIIWLNKKFLFYVVSLCFVFYVYTVIWAELLEINLMMMMMMKALKANVQLTLDTDGSCSTYFVCNILLVPLRCDVGRQMLRKLHNCPQHVWNWNIKCLPHIETCQRWIFRRRKHRKM